MTTQDHAIAVVAADTQEPPPPRGQLRLFVDAFASNKLAVAGLVVFVLAILVALTADVISPYDPNAQDLAVRLMGPSAEHWLGTDQYGRDLLSRVIHGTQISLMVGIVSITIATLCGVTAGALSGYLGGFVDDIIMRCMDVLLAFPALILAIGILAVLGPSILNVVIVIAVVSTPQIARITRSAVLTQKEEEYVQAAIVIGLPMHVRLFKHVLLNCLAPITVQATLLVANAIIVETSLSFLGLGVRPPTPTWGTILFEGKDYILLGMWWMSVFPGIAIILAMLGLNLLGDGLRDALDPRIRGADA
ncbi:MULTISPECIES: ABC transporter permease [Thalassobaculum]|uniref:Peptide/nickel transport system permease protein n=1 Tax=Thalassobaculum litoreum DSM 18839 TaxID=1123362 RepID=A0A8G2BHN9_9PROT|nr:MULTISPECIES: ABC transporter permease [Thalassobaculum]SDF50125.1 peptide/nickel transport system permease protein [Thalassobaculum litoreum DSM 18839]